MNIDWLAFLTVFVAALLGAVIVVSLYSLGIRFLATPAPSPGEAHGPSRDDEDDDVDDLARPKWATAAANVCFGLSVLSALAGIFLIIPALHFWE